jgi:Rrf2 family protein
LRISRAATYALLAAIQLNDSSAAPPIPCSQLAKLGNMPERFLLQVLRSLVNQGLLRSTRGVDGGYRLMKPLSQISLLDIIEAADDPIQPELPKIAGLSPQSQRRLAQAYGDIADDIKKRLRSVMLSELKPAGAAGAAAKHRRGSVA